MSHISVAVAVAIPALAVSLGARGQTSEADHAAHHGPSASAPSSRTASALTAGEVRGVDVARKRVTLRHGPIAGLDMPDGHGTREMPIWGDVFVTEEVGKSTRIEDAMKASDDASRRIAGLVRYVESIQVK